MLPAGCGLLESTAEEVWVTIWMEADFWSTTKRLTERLPELTLVLSAPLGRGRWPLCAG